MSAGGERGWYLRRGRYQVGPFPVDEIAHLLQDGRIAEGDFARRSGSREWFPAIARVGLAIGAAEADRWELVASLAHDASDAVRAEINELIHAR